MSRSFQIFLVGIALLFAAFVAMPVFFWSGEQILDLPDGQFRAQVWRREREGASYKFTISNIKADDVVMRFDIHPVHGRPSQDARGGARIFEWTADSRQLRITLDGQVWGTIDVPVTGIPQATFISS